MEFSTAAEIFRSYGPNGITRYDLNNAYNKALISDDTQMTLFTAVGLLFGMTRGELKGIGGDGTGFIRKAYLDWYMTQTRPFPLPEDYFSVSWLINCSSFFHRRAPGNTCMSALLAGGNGTIDSPINNSKGCGGIMRVAPIGLYFIERRETIDSAARIGAEAAAVTHGHELGYIPAAALVHIIYSLASGRHSDILSAGQDSMSSMKRLFPNAQHMDEFQSVMEKAIALSESDITDVVAIHQIGGGWVAEETLAIAVYCALKYSHDFEKAIIASVNHNGDSDSTGAVTGNILGAYLGIDAIPDYYLNDLEMKDIILEIADDLYRDVPIDDSDHIHDQVWLRKYLYMDYAGE